VVAEATARTREARLTDRYDGETAASIAERLQLPAVHLYASIGSTMDAAHALGVAGAPAGTMVVADEQTAGRGRQGGAWRSPASRGVWLTLLERPADATGLDVLSLRVGLAAARALDALADGPVRLKWPNDLFVAGGKVAGVLVEARWRGRRPDWVAIGLGVNVRPPRDVPSASGLREGASRIDVLLGPLVPAVRVAAARRGPLDEDELADYAARDYARGRRCVLPARGIVAGVSPAGELAVETSRGLERHRGGSLVLEEGA
jgi:BirA family transcriptional regulator, biotin operon repressor / biotin---[acetyl-CoA-carboxylase] ligase